MFEHSHCFQDESEVVSSKHKSTICIDSIHPSSNYFATWRSIYLVPDTGTHGCGEGYPNPHRFEVSLRVGDIIEMDPGRALLFRFPSQTVADSSSMEDDDIPKFITEEQ